MPLRDTAKTVHQNLGGTRCETKFLIERLDADDRAWLLEQMADETKQHAWIARVLKEEGYDLSTGSLSRHRRGDCRCES